MPKKNKKVETSDSDSGPDDVSLFFLIKSRTKLVDVVSSSVLSLQISIIYSNLTILDTANIRMSG